MGVDINFRMFKSQLNWTLGFKLNDSLFTYCINFLFIIFLITYFRTLDFFFFTRAKLIRECEIARKISFAVDFDENRF